MMNFDIPEEFIEQIKEAPPPEAEEHATIDISRTPLEVYCPNVGQLDSAGFALIRRNGFGGSDSSILCGVNPFTTLPELIKQKASTTVSEEEKAIGKQVAVLKGNELEPLVLKTAEKVLQAPVVKPADMYRFTDWPWLTMNFDGVVDQGDKYVPAEAKIVTRRGEKRYNPTKVWYDSFRGFFPYPDNHAIKNISIESKAALYGIPPYYYTQIQQEMLALNASYGYLMTLWDDIWTYRCYIIHQDPAVQRAIIINGEKAWTKVEALREKQNNG